jgi:hypothetical protein
MILNLKSLTTYLRNYTSRFHFVWKKYTYRFQLTHSILGFTPMELITLFLAGLIVILAAISIVEF